MMLAIVPVIVPLLGLLLTGGGIFALLKFRKPKPSPAPSSPELPPSSGGGGKTPAVETGDVPMIEFREVTFDDAEVGATGKLEKKGATWTYRVTGRDPATGGNADPGKALVEMAQAFATAMKFGQESNITGSATSPTNPKVAFSVTNNQDLWDWVITTASPLPSPVPGVPSAPRLLEDGYEERRSTATLAMMVALQDHLDWLVVPKQVEEGAGAPTPPAPPAPEPEGPSLPGIKVIGTNLGVTNLNAWVAYAAPAMRELVESGADADGIMDDVLGQDLPESTRVQGKTLAAVRERLQKLLDDVRSKTYLAPPSPDQALAAAIVGMTYEIPDGWVANYKDHTILVRRAKPQGGGGGGKGLAVGDRFEYTIWTGLMRGYDDASAERRTMDSGVSRGKTIKAARDRIDAELGEEPEPEQPDGAIAPLVVVNAGLVPVQPIDYKARKKLPLEAATWMARTTRELVIFDFAQGELSKRKDWTIGIAVCLTNKQTMPFGSLSAQLVGQGPDYGQFGDPMARFEIRQKNGGAVGQWDDFRRPLAFKGQYLGKFERGPTVLITKQLADISGTDAAREYDPCKDTEYQWPTPQDPSGFLVRPTAAQYMTPWTPIPTFKIVASGPKIVLKISFSGFPIFADTEGGMSPAIAAPTKFSLDVKVWASGINL